MTKFNPDNKEILTYGEALGPAMKITDPEDAKQYLKEYVAYQEIMLIKEPRNDGMTAEQMCKINLGYYAGYYDNETRARVERLFNCSHPIFGSIETNGQPSTEKALSKGQQMAADSKNN